MPFPQHSILDEFSNMYFSDTLNHVVRMIDGTTNTLSTIAGTRVRGYSGDNGPATQAELNSPTSLSFDADGNLLIVDEGNIVIRKVDITTGIITTVFDLDSLSNDGSSVSVSSLNSRANRRHRSLVSASDVPSTSYHMTTDSDNNLYISSALSCVVIKVASDPSYNNGTGYGIFLGTYGVCGYEGDGESLFNDGITVKFNNPLGITYNPNLDTLVIVDNRNNRVRTYDFESGNLSTLIGTGNAGYSGDGGLAIAATISNPKTVTIGVEGNLYLADSGNNVVRVLNGTSGSITTYAGTGVGGYNGDGLSPLQAELNGPYSVTAGDSPGSLYITDTGNNRIRYISFASKSPTSQPTGIVFISSNANQLVTGGFIAIWTAVSVAGVAGIILCLFYCCFIGAAMVVIDKDNSKVDWYRLDIDPIDIDIYSSDLIIEEIEIQELSPSFKIDSKSFMKPRSSKRRSSGSFYGISDSQILHDDVVMDDYEEDGSTHIDYMTMFNDRDEDSDWGENSMIQVQSSFTSSRILNPVEEVDNESDDNEEENMKDKSDSPHMISVLEDSSDDNEFFKDVQSVNGDDDSSEGDFVAKGEV